jgi:hypothetical protein
MPRSAGVFSLASGNPVGTGTVASSTVMNNTLDDIAAGLTQSIAKDGQTAVTADLPMGTNKLTNVGNAVARNQYASAGQVQDGGLVTLGSVAGTNTITGAYSPAVAAYVNGMRVSFKPANTNTGAVTIAINGLSAVAIVKGSGDALVAGDLVASVPAFLIYDGTRFFLMNPLFVETEVEVSSGTYTPIVTNSNNTTGTPTASVHQYMRVGSTVTVSGTCLATSSGAGQCNLSVSLPIASSFSTLSQCGGGGGALQGTTVSALYASSNAVSDCITLVWSASSATSFGLVYSATYQII